MISSSAASSPDFGEDDDRKHNSSSLSSSLSSSSTPDEYSSSSHSFSSQNYADDAGEAGSLTSIRMEAMYGQPSFGFAYTHPARAACIRIIESPWFSSCITLIICINYIILILDSYSPPYQNILRGLNQFFIAAFTLEMCLKMFALGLYSSSQFAYFRDPWCIFDFLIVVAGYMFYIPSAENLTFIRAFRLLRPLRTVSFLPRCRVMLQALIRTVPALRKVGLLVFGCIFVFALFALTFFQGDLRYRCIKMENGVRLLSFFNFVST
jgi:hypothetical protein